MALPYLVKIKEEGGLIHFEKFLKNFFWVEDAQHFVLYKSLHSVFHEPSKFTSNGPKCEMVRESAAAPSFRDYASGLRYPELQLGRPR